MIGKEEKKKFRKEKKKEKNIEKRDKKINAETSDLHPSVMGTSKSEN
jgi:hypothetical protein